MQHTYKTHKFYNIQNSFYKSDFYRMMFIYKNGEWFCYSLDCKDRTIKPVKNEIILAELQNLINR